MIGAAGHVHDPAGALDFIARVQMEVLAEQHDADFISIHIERDSEQITRKPDQFLKTHIGEAGDHGDASSHAGDCAHFPSSQVRSEGFPHPGYLGYRVVIDALNAL